MKTTAPLRAHPGGAVVVQHQEAPIDRTATYTTTAAGDIVRRMWVGACVFIAVLRVGTKTPTFVGILDPICPAGTAGGWRATGMRRALGNEVILGETADYLDAETLLLAHRSGRRSIEPWEPPAIVVRNAAARAELARRRKAAGPDGGFPR